MSIYIFDRDSAGHWGYSVVGTAGNTIYESEGHETFYLAAEDAEEHATSRGEDLDQPISITTTKRPEHPPVVDLMAALEESVNQAKAARKAAQP